MQSDETHTNWPDTGSGNDCNPVQAPWVTEFTATQRYSSHRLVINRFFYTLPVKLIEAVEAEVGAARFDRDLMEMEVTLSGPCDDHSRFAGYWNGSPLPYRGLKLRYMRLLTEKDKARLPLQAQKALKQLTVYDVSWDYPTYRRDFRSYAGWLLTNNQFLDEQARLFTEHAEAIRRWGPRDDLMPEAQTIYFDESKNPNNDPLWRQYTCDQQDFFVRWRLGGMAGPYLPEPLEPDMLGRIDPKFVDQFASAGSVFFLPDIVTLPSRDELRASIEHARDRYQKAEHLQGWFELIRSDSAARNQLDRLSRIFELQHYWRILHSRHATSLKKSISKLEIAFAVWFDVSPETIHGDLIRVRQRLGKNWLDRPFPDGSDC
jgi:hypothetical protein